MKTFSQSPLSCANAAFRDGDFESAIALYEAALDQAQGPLKVHISFNLDLALRRLASSSATVTSALKKPDGLAQFYFDLIKQSGFFDPDWYLAHYKDKHHITLDPLAHYLAHGVDLSTNPSPKFDTAYYLKAHEDVAKSGMHPFLHYVSNGYKEGRQARPLFERSLDIYQSEAPHYVPRLTTYDALVEKAVRVIAFYLPQFHIIPENDNWWGKGFTEWTNVRPARPQFEGHYQPHEPDDFLGYYDLRDTTTVLRKQIELTKQYGIEGFCFYTYWFSGTRLLETPVDNYLADAALDLPFCICWANENWSRRWDGLDNDLLMVQHYSDQDDIAFIEHMAKYLRDPRYIRVQGKPLLIVYRPNLFPSMNETAQRWRGWCRENGLGEIYIAYVQSFEKRDPAEYGLDAAIEFPPNNSSPPDVTAKVSVLSPDFSGRVYDWRVFLQRSENNEPPAYPLFRGACPSWDNTARKKERGTIFTHSSPKLFERWLVNVFADTLQSTEEFDQRLVFVNAWNEWAEGAHLEPDQRYGYAWLQAVRDANQKTLALSSIKVAVVIHAFYPEILQEIMDRASWMSAETTTLYVTTNEGKETQIRNILDQYPFRFSINTYTNRGRDVLPFLKVLPKVLEDGADLVLKLHTKKSPHRVDGEQWRKELFDKLLSKQFMMKAKLELVSGVSLGLAAPAEHVVPMSYYWGSNQLNMESLCRRIGCDNPIFEDAEFVAGTMFIATKALLNALLGIGMSESEFELEAGQVDGTMAHAIERMIGFLCHVNDYKILKYGDEYGKPYRYAAVTK